MTEKYRRVRASSLPRLKVCPASYAESQGKLNPSSQPAALGSAFHALMAEATAGGRDCVDVTKTAAAFGVDSAELNSLWQRFDFDPSGGEAEVQVEIVDHEARVIVPGHLDWVKPDHAQDGVFDLADWKTTHRVDEDPEPWADPQTKAYAVGFFDSREGVRAVRTFKAYPRRGTNGWSAAYEITADEVDAVREEVLVIAREAVRQSEEPQEERRFVMSHHCDYCPGRVTCPALRLETTALMNAVRDVAVLKKDGKPGKRTQTMVDIDITFENAPKLHELRKLLEKGAKALGEQIKLFIDGFGPVEVEPGKYLAVKPTERRASLNEATLRRAGAVLGLEQEVDRILAWRDGQPKTTEGRLDIYTEASLAATDDAE